MLPEIKRLTLQSLTLPTAWQTVIFRNIGYVKTERIAKVLGCDENTVEREAARLGLVYRDLSDAFEKRGYITTVRRCWYLLPYSQIMTLLDCDEERLDFILKHEDFLSVKLGRVKPDVPEVKYAPLSEEELRKTEEISTRVAAYAGKSARDPFDLLRADSEAGGEISPKGRRIVHPYLSPCGDPFLTDCRDTIPDSLLMEYKRVGVNGIWLHGNLSGLSPYPFAPELSRDYLLRRKNLNSLISRCKKYGIDLFLYFNEPRALPKEKVHEHGYVVGDPNKGTVCMQTEAARDYLYGAVRSLCEAAPDLGGIFTITMSENATHCHYRTATECPVCKKLAPELTAPLVNNIIAKAMRDSGCRGELVANLWGWSQFLDWSDEQIFRAVDTLDSDISVCCVSEYDLEIEKGGVKSRIIDYSISNPGPSEITKKVLSHAKASGHKIYGKIQASNSWECSAVPYIPAFDLVARHMSGLSRLGVNDYFLTWTLGGYPSPSVELACEYGEGFDLEEWYRRRFGECADELHSAIKLFCEGFDKYPFSLDGLYYSPKGMGPANLWDDEPENKESLMVCYSYDDVESWINPYPCQVYISELEKMTVLCEEALTRLKALPSTSDIGEITRYAEVFLCHYYTDIYQTKHAMAKRVGDRAQMRKLWALERENTERLLKLVREDGRIGFEASNHYLYTERELLEKLLRCEMHAK